MTKPTGVKLLPTTNVDTDLNKQKATTESQDQDQAQAVEYSEETTLVNNSASNGVTVDLPDDIIDSKDNNGYLDRIKELVYNNPKTALVGAVALGIGAIAAGACLGSWIYNKMAGNDEENNITASPNNNSTSNPITYYLTSVNDKIWSAVSEKLTSLTTDQTSTSTSLSTSTSPTTSTTTVLTSTVHACKPVPRPGAVGNPDWYDELPIVQKIEWLKYMYNKGAAYITAPERGWCNFVLDNDNTVIDIDDSVVHLVGHSN